MLLGVILHIANADIARPIETMYIVRLTINNITVESAICALVTIALVMQIALDFVSCNFMPYQCQLLVLLTYCTLNRAINYTYIGCV